MYKIMLADDEGIVIDALTYIINKNFGEQCLIEHAKTGRSVIELAEHFRPDIAFMDIQMPGINGIEAMKEIRKSNKNTIFIVISAYDKFDYAKEAITLGVMDYVNKPIQQQEIIALLKRAMEKVDQEKEKRSNDLLIREKLETVVPIIESGFIYSVLFQENYVDEIDNFKQLLGIVENFGYMMVIRCGDSQIDGQLTNAVGASVRAQSYYMELRDIIKQYFPGIVGNMMANMVIVYIPVKEEEKTQEYQRRIDSIEQARKMVKKLKETIDAHFQVGIGSIQTIGKIGTSYSEAMNSFRYSSGSVAHANDLPVTCEYEGDYPIETEKNLFAAVEQGDINQSRLEAVKFFDWMLEKHSDSPQDIKMKALEFVLLIEKIGYLSGGMSYHFGSRHDYLSAITSLQSMDDIKNWYLEKILIVCRNILNKKEMTVNSITEKAKEYIKLHFHKDLSLDDVSREVNVSPYYFSKLFKEETGENFIEYLTAIRMEKAKELLSQTGKSMKEICSEVGYTDPNYFSRSFKKNVGVTPTEFKEGK